MPVEGVTGSFRDPSGRVYLVDGRILRTVSPAFLPHFDFVWSTGLIDRLIADGRLLPARVINEEIPRLFPGGGVAALLEAPRLPFVSYPYEWPFTALKDAALLHLDVHLEALTRGVTLSDASSFNVQFQGPSPIFIDHLSFRQYQEGEVWSAHRQFCEQFLLPLLLRALFGLTHNAWFRGTLEGIPLDEFRRLLTWRHYLNRKLLTHVVMHAWLHRTGAGRESDIASAKAVSTALPLAVFRKVLEELRRWIATLQPAGASKTTWQNYAHTTTYATEETALKREFVREFIAARPPRQLWDFGCNTGDYSKVALEAGAEYVVGFDFDQGALEVCRRRAIEDSLRLQPLVFDVANPTPNQGWGEAERLGMRARSSADAILVLALIHHVAISKNIPFDQLLDWLLDLAPRGIIEFVPKTDPMVQRLLALREDIFPDYTLEYCRTQLERRARIVKTCEVSSSGRTLLWYEGAGPREQ